MGDFRNVEAVFEWLVKNKYTISFAESCTAGLAAARFVDIPSASSAFNQSFVTYINESKVKLLGVSASDIDKYGVVSEAVAEEMARGAAEAAGAEVGVGISGIAGPTGATPGKPVGTVCFGFYVCGKAFASTCNFGNIGRRNVREKSVDYVFETLAEYLKTL